MDGYQLGRTEVGTFTTQGPAVKPDRTDEAASVPDPLSQLRRTYPHWAFMYDDRAGLFHAVRGRRHFVATTSDGPWHRADTVRMW